MTCSNLADARTFRILLADDDPIFRPLIADRLVRRGHTLEEAEDGGEVIERFFLATSLQKAPPDVLLLDVNMPTMSGVDVLVALRCAGWDTPVLLMTANPNAELDVIADEWGAAAVLEKPFSTDALETALLNVHSLSARRLRTRRAGGE
jgi:CheY-like chemotaxis protein